MNKSINRRNFLRISAVAGAGAAFLPKSVSAGAIQPVDVKSDVKKETEISVRTLGKTGIEIPILSMGVMRADNPSVLRAAYNSGIKHFDTAHGYQEGKNEEMCGNFFKDKPRDSFIISTKIHFNYPLKDNFEKEMDDNLALSLKRLQMDYVDIFYLHAVKDNEALTEKRVIEWLEKIKKEGKAKFTGLSTHAGKPEILDAAIEANAYDVILMSYNFKMGRLDQWEVAMDRAVKAGIGLIAMKTMAGGVEGADGKKKVNGQACLKWAWKNSNITTAIPGFTNYDLLDDCLAAAKSPELTETENTYLASLKNTEMMYCQQCNKCEEQCPEHLPIPDLMRVYMYAYGYKHAQLSKETLNELHLSKDICNSCTNGCKVHCVSGFKVGEKIAAVKPVMDIPYVLLS
ncbi:MAG: aldo/keto reductase [Tannerella sp.]|jgi:predicted aldo/keto reductase-like oxidoreductase|nr:aldo/keto reductase [Tannerella sp.]